MPTREPDLAERNSGRIETRADYITPEAQADGPLSKLRALLEEGLRGRIFTRFRQALERLKNSINRTVIDESNAPKEESSSKITRGNSQITGEDTRISRRDFLKLCGATVVAAATGIFPGRKVSAAETGTSPTEPNSETEALVLELERIITEAKDFIASKVPMLKAYPDTLQRMDRTNAVIGLQIPSDIGNPPSSNPNEPNKNGFELGSRIYSPYPDSNDQEKGVIYQRIIADLKKIKELKEYQSASSEKQKEMLLRYLNSLGEQILERQKQYSAAMSKFPGKRTRAGISAEVVDYVDFIADALGITDPEIKAAILRTHPHVAQIIAMQQAGFDVDIQMNGLPPRFVERDGSNPWPIFNPIKPDAIQAFTEFVRILSLALSTEGTRISTANEPLNIHMDGQPEKYAKGLVEAQLNNNSGITLIGPSIKTDYKGELEHNFPHNRKLYR